MAHPTLHRRQALRALAAVAASALFVGAFAAWTAAGGTIHAEVCDTPGAFDAQGAAFYGLFGLDWATFDVDGGGIPDSYELALLGDVLCDGTHALFAAASAVYGDNLAELPSEDAYDWLSPYENALAGLVSVNQGLNDILTGALGFTGAYAVIGAGGGEPFAPAGDVDADGADNLYEHDWVASLGGSAADYVAAANDASVLPDVTRGCLDAADFDEQGTAFYGLFAIDWATIDIDANGMADGPQAAAFGDLLCDDTDPLFTDANDAYLANLTTLSGEDQYYWLSLFEKALVACMTSNQAYADLIVGVFGLTGSYVSIDMTP